MVQIILTAVLFAVSTISYGQDCQSPAEKVNPDPLEFGPWDVGARTVQIDGLTAEIWYPSDPSINKVQEVKTYDIRKQLPDREAGKIPDEDNPTQFCQCYDGIPIAEAKNPFPVVLFIHGTASFRTQALNQMTHWASRGFVVVSLDHPRIRLKDILGPGGTIGAILANQARDGRKALNALRSPKGELAFLEGRINMNKIALSGHSAGAGAIAKLSGEKGVEVVMPMTAGSARMDDFKGYSLFFGAEKDGVGSYKTQVAGYEDHPGTKAFVGLLNAGHLAYSEICYLGRDQGGILAIAQKHGVRVPSIVASLGYDGCGDEFLSPQEGWEIINYASTKVLEKTLYCNKSKTDWPEIESRFDGKIDFRK